MTAIDHPRVSVALPVHNCERYVAEAIESILAQTFTDLSVTVSEGTTFSVRRVPLRNQWVSAKLCSPFVSNAFFQELT